MRPESYIEKDGKVFFLYSYKDYMTWYLRGKEFGDAGSLLHSMDGVFYTYETFGTIEHPFKEMCQLQLVHNPIFDGVQIEPYELLLSPVQSFMSLTDHELLILNFDNEQETR